jgi:hypothetical protein
MIKPLDAVQGAPSDATAIAVVDKLTLKIFVNLVVYEMMHNPVTKIRRENFPLHRIERNKAGAWSNTVPPAQYFIIQREYFGFVIEFKRQRVRG